MSTEKNTYFYGISRKICRVKLKLTGFKVSNALRFNLCKPHDLPHDQAGHCRDLGDLNALNEKPALQKTLLISVMMCEHCKHHVKEALEDISGVHSACANYKDDTVTISLDADIPESTLQTAVQEAGYKIDV